MFLIVLIIAFVGFFGLAFYSNGKAGDSPFQLMIGATLIIIAVGLLFSSCSMI